MTSPSDPTLIRGADGALFYLPAGELDRYRVPEDTAAEVVAKLTALEIAATAEPGDGADREEAEVSGFSFTSPLSPSSFGLTGLNPSPPLLGDGGKLVVFDARLGTRGYIGGQVVNDL